MRNDDRRINVESRYDRLLLFPIQSGGTSITRSEWVVGEWVGGVVKQLCHSLFFLEQPDVSASNHALSHELRSK